MYTQYLFRNERYLLTCTSEYTQLSPDSRKDIHVEAIEMLLNNEKQRAVVSCDLEGTIEQLSSSETGGHKITSFFANFAEDDISYDISFTVCKLIDQTLN